MGKNQDPLHIVKVRIVSYVLMSVSCIRASHTVGKNEKKIFLIVNCQKKVFKKII